MKDNSFDSEEYHFDSELGSETDSKSQNEDKSRTNIELIKAIAKTLTMIIDENEKLPNLKEIIKKQSKLIFSANSIPKISLYDYLIRIQTYTHLERSTLISSLIYIDRLCELGKLTLTYFNIHRILVGSILIAIKYNEDSVYNNKYYSEIAGVDIKELNSIEYKFIELCNFKMFISEKIFEHYSNYLESFKKINNKQKNNENLNIFKFW